MSVLRPQQLSTLIGSIYDCALDPKLWPAAIERVAHAIGAVHGAVRVLDPRTRSLRLNITWGGDERWTRTYNETYYALVPTLPNQIEMVLDATYHTRHMIPLGEFRASKFYREWAAPQAFEDVAGMLFLKQSDRVAWSSYYLPRVIDKRDNRISEFVSLLAPHFRRAALIGDLLDMRTIEAADFRTVVDNLAFGVFLVDRDARLLHANRCGEAMLGEGDVVSRKHNRIRLRDAATGSALLMLLAKLSQNATAASKAGTSVALASAQGIPSLLHVLPLQSGSPHTRIEHAAVAALFIAPRTAVAPTWHEAVAALYDLSNAEIRVLGPLLLGKAPREIAAELSLGEPTVRTHLRALYAKTGTARQGELIALLKGITQPVLA